MFSFGGSAVLSPGGSRYLLPGRLSFYREFHRLASDRQKSPGVIMPYWFEYRGNYA